MRNSLKLSAGINFILIIFRVMFLIDTALTFLIIPIIFLGGTGLLYLKYANLPIEELYQKRSSILWLGIITLPINVVTSVILFITHDKITKEYNRNLRYGENIEKYKPEDIIPPEIRKIDIMLKLGVGMVTIAGIIFATSSWSVISDAFKIIFLILFGILFMGLSKFCEKKLKLTKTTKTYWILSFLFFILSYVALGYFEVFGEWFSFYGYGQDLFRTILCLIISTSFFISYLKFFEKEWIIISYGGILLTFYFFLTFLKLCPNMILFILITLLSLLNFLNKSKKRELIYLKEFSKIASLVITVFTIFNYVDINLESKRKIFIIILTGIVSLLNIIYISFEKDDEALGGIAPVLLSMNTFSTILFLELPKTPTTLLLIASHSIIYVFLILSKLSLKNKVFNLIFQITTNLSLASIVIYSSSINEGIFLLTSSIFLFLNIITIILKKDFNLEVNFEYYFQPLKILLFSISWINLLNTNYFIIERFLKYCLYSLIMVGLHLVISEKRLKYEYFISFCFLLIFSLIEVLINKDCFNGGLAILQLVLFFIPFLITENNKERNYNILKIPLYIFFLIASYNLFINVYSFDLPTVLSAVIVMGLYIALIFVYSSQKDLFTITFLALSLPYNILMANASYNYEIKMIIDATFYFYLLTLTCSNLIRNREVQKIISSLGIIFILSSIIFEQSLLIGLYIGIISILLVYIGFIDDKQRNIFYIGIGSTILNIIIQLWDVWSQIPFWLYLLIAGLGTIGTVTYLEMKKTNKSEDNNKVIPIPVTNDDDKTKI